MKIMTKVSVGLAIPIVGIGGLWAAEVVRQAPPEYEREPIRLASAVHHTGDHLALPAAIESDGDRLVVIDRRGEESVHVIDSDDGSWIASVGPPGDGPAEFRSPVAITRDREGRVWVFDTENQRMTRLDLGRLDDGNAWADRSFRLSSTTRVLDLTWTADAGMLAWGLFREGRYGRLDVRGRLEYETGTFPAVAAGEPAILNQQVYRVRFAAHPNGRLIVAAARHAGRIDIVDAEGVARVSAAAPVPFEPSFDVRGAAGWPMAVFTDESRLGYIDVAATEGYIFALFSGRTAADFQGRSAYARDVHVFDWNGRLVEILRLDRDVAAIEVDAGRAQLFAIQHDPMPAILRFSLPPQLQENRGSGRVASTYTGAGEAR